MYVKQKSFILLLLFIYMAMASLAGAGSGDNIGKPCKGPDLQQVYQYIKYSSPLYQWDETIVNFTNEGMKMVGSLVIPQTRKKSPIIITLNGFTGNRNDGIVPGTEEQIWKRFSRILAENGIASLRIDFRGSGDSDGKYEMSSFSTQISDALAAVDYITVQLKHRVDTDAIGIFGFSQGGLIGAAAAAAQPRVNSLVLWSPVANAPLCYEGLLTKAGLKAGLAITNNTSISLGIYVEDKYYYDITLGKGFFKDIFDIDPIGEIKEYKNPLLVIVGIHDVITWPQPEMGRLFLKYHDGCEKLISMEADHYLANGNNAETVDEAILWTTAWFIKTLEFKE